MSRSGSCGTASNISRVFLTLSSGIFSSKRTFPYETAVEEQRISLFVCIAIALTCFFQELVVQVPALLFIRIAADDLCR